MSDVVIKFTYIQEGDVIGTGDYRFICIATPGHTPGHMCLYEPEDKFLISEDHILSGITPNITSWMGGEDSLEAYLFSLDKVDAMDIRMILPGHRGVIGDYHKRTQELKHHHEVQREEILNILREGPINAYQVASHMKWGLKYDCWEQYPEYDKRVAIGETVAHLEYGQAE